MSSRLNKVLKTDFVIYSLEESLIGRPGSVIGSLSPLAADIGLEVLREAYVCPLYKKSLCVLLLLFRVRAPQHLSTLCLVVL